MMAIDPNDPGTIPMTDVLGSPRMRQGKIPTLPAPAGFRLTAPRGASGVEPAEQGSLDFSGAGAAPAKAEAGGLAPYDPANVFSIPPFLRRA